MSIIKDRLKTYSFFLLLFLIFNYSCDKEEPIRIDNEENPENLNQLSYKDIKCSSCDHVIPTDEWKFDGDTEIVQPGDTIGIIGGIIRQRLTITNLKGTKENPIVIINCDGRAEIGTSTLVPFGMRVEKSKHFKIAGTGSSLSNHKYGIAVKGHNALAIEYLSSNYEVYGIEVLAASFAGIVARSNARCDGTVSKDNFTQYSTILHDNYVHDTEGEGFYVGGSHWGDGQLHQPGCVGKLLFEPELKKVRVYNNIIHRTGLDGIQVGSAVEDCEIFNNYIKDYALLNHQSHQTGIQIGNGTTGKVYNNIIDTGKGYGIFCLGRGDNLIYNNLIINPKLDGFFAGDRHPTPGLGFKFIHNTIVNPGGNGINFLSQVTSNNAFYNNIIANVGDEFIRGWPNYIEDGNLFTNDKTIINTLFINPNEGDYRLKNNAIVAIDKGIDLKELKDVIKTDLKGVKRIGKYDIGAFEYN